ncbi:MAG: AsnC family protein [Halolamina sp.]|uniref:AsnC family protein n=1 Tax=Halolamina sp. TaxID=1940283 RepID=UPI002FC355F5
MPEHRFDEFDEIDTQILVILSENPRMPYQKLSRRLADEAAEMRRLLVRGGVIVDDLLDDFVSYSVVRTHLTECLGERRDPSPACDWEEDRIDQLDAYAVDEAADALRSLANKGKLSAGGELQASLSFEVTCSACGVSVPFDEALQAEGFCDCS